MKLLFFDLETTGVKFWRNGIHQIGGIVDIDGQEAERFDIRLAPNPAATIEQEALDVAGVTLEQVQSYQPMEEGYRQLVGILSKYVNKFDKRDKMYLVGYNNAGFDNNFLRALFEQCTVHVMLKDDGELIIKALSKDKAVLLNDFIIYVNNNGSIDEEDYDLLLTK